MVGDRINARRKALRLTQADLAEKLGISQPRVSQLIHSDDLNLRTIKKIAMALGVTESYLIREK